MDADQELRVASALYAGVADDALWQQALKETARAIDTDRCIVLARHTPSDEIMVVDNAGIESDALHAYNDYYHSLDALMEAARDVPTGETRHDRQILNEDAIRRSPFYNEFLHRYDTGSIMFTPTLREPETDWIVAFHRSCDSPMFDVSHERVLQRLTPHLQKALRLRLQLRDLEHRALLGSSALNTFSTPLLLVNSSGRALLANTAGQAWYTRQASNLERSERWQHCLASATGRLGPPVAEGLRLPDDSHVITLPAPPALQNAARLVLVLIHTRQPTAPPSPEMLKSLFGLSSAEYRLLELLMTGITLAQASQHLGISVETVRTQSKSVLQKTNCRRQTDLMRLMSALQRPTPTA